MEKLVEDLLKNKEIKEFVQKHKLTEDDILKAYRVFSLKKECDDYCSLCKKNGECLNPNQYCKCVLEFNNRPNSKFVSCQYEPKDNLVTYFFEQNKGELYKNKERAMIIKELISFNQKYLNNEHPKGIYIYGGYGQGKSFILYSFAKELSENGKKVIYAYYPDLTRQIKSSIGSNQLETMIEELKKVDILMLDDLGGENNTAYLRDEVLGPILQYRMNEDLPVFATSNYNLEELLKHFADTNNENDRLKAGRIIQRLRNLMTPYELKDKDYRNGGN